MHEIPSSGRITEDENSIFVERSNKKDDLPIAFEKFYIFNHFSSIIFFELIKPCPELVEGLSAIS